MTDRRRAGALEGADDSAMGTAPAPQPAPPAAEVVSAEHLVPGADLGDRVPLEAKPWSTSLAAESPQAGVANDSPAAQEPQFPDADDEAL